jgi:hypothetical protein
LVYGSVGDPPFSAGRARGSRSSRAAGLNHLCLTKRAELTETETITGRIQ